MHFSFTDATETETEFGFVKKYPDIQRHPDILPSHFIFKQPPMVVAGLVPELTETNAKHRRQAIIFSIIFVPENNVTL